METQLLVCYKGRVFPEGFDYGGKVHPVNSTE